MIKVKDTYFIDTDTYCYMVKKLIGHDKNNEPQYTTLTYHSSIAEALESILRRLERAVVGEGDMALPEALEKFRVLKDEFMEILVDIKDSESVKD